MRKKSAFRILPALLLFLSAATASPALAQETFEGVLKYKMGIESDSYDFSILFQQDRMRMEYQVREQSGAMLYYPGKNQVVVLIETAKSYMTINQDDIDTTKINTYRADIYHEMEETGETRVIDDRKCRVWRSEQEKNTIEACLTDQIDGMKISRFPEADLPAGPDWQQYPKGHMPLEVQAISPNGDRSLLMKLTDFEIKELDDSLFEIPDDYRDITDMMKNRN